MRLHTVQLAKWRAVQSLGIPMKDTTAKSGDALFAPEWANVKDYKAGLLSEADYTERYLQKMRDSYRQNREQWLSFIEQPEVAIACYCPAGKFCHRHLLKGILEALCRQQNVSFEYAGEIQ